MTLLALRDVAKRFGATVALDGVSLDVDGGEVHALIGENGAGKSTLLNVLSGLLKPDRGEVTAGGRVAHIHQELSIFPHLSVEENILMGSPRRVTRAAALLEEFGRGDIPLRARAGALSIADQQVIEICRALAWNARILLMDEPTSSLQHADVARLFAIIRRLRERGVAIVYVSHFLEEVREIASRFTVLRDGRGVLSGAIADASDEQLIAAMVGRRIDSVFPPQALAAEGEVVLDVRDLASAPRLRSATFSLRRGEILGIAGLIGSGRTDLVRALFGLRRITGGTIVRNGTLGYLSEDRKNEGLALPLSIADNVTMSRLRTVARGGWIDLRRQNAAADSIMRRLRIKAAGARTRVFRLSGGNQQKVAFGRLLHHDPDILLLDEPARGIDIGSKSDIYAEVVRLAREGKAILMVSSYLPELLGICDRVAVMSRGRLSAARPASEWTPDSIMETAIGAA